MRLECIALSGKPRLMSVPLAVFLVAPAAETADFEHFLLNEALPASDWKAAAPAPSPTLALGAAEVALVVGGIGGLLRLLTATRDWLQRRDDTEITVETRKNGRIRKLIIKRKMSPQELDDAVKKLWPDDA